MEIFANLSLPLQAVLTVGGIIALSFLGRRLTEKALAGRDIAKAREAANAMRQPIGTIVALTLALTTVQALEALHRAESIVAREVNVLESLYRDSRAYGGPLAEKFRGALQMYIDSVIATEWAAMAQLRDDDETWRRFDVLFDVVSAMQAEDSRQRMWLNEIVRRLNQATELRRERLEEAEKTIPGIFWVVTLVGTTVMIGLACLLPAGLISDVIVIAFSAVYGMVFLLIATLDLPFSGDMGVKSTSFQALQSHLRRLDSEGSDQWSSVK